MGYFATAQLLFMDACRALGLAFRAFIVAAPVAVPGGVQQQQPAPAPSPVPTNELLSMLLQAGYRGILDPLLATPQVGCWPCLTARCLCKAGTERNCCRPAQSEGP